ncbi:hypothetical protein HDU96_004626 [Phlyctochytrium bullatum]|nr:hypothetical protein HDU96_004626 [Phlyctochytrium bullatum]
MPKSYMPSEACDDEASLPPAVTNALHNRDDALQGQTIDEPCCSRDDTPPIVPPRRYRRQGERLLLVSKALASTYTTEEFENAARVATYVPEGVDLDRLSRIFVNDHEIRRQVYEHRRRVRSPSPPLSQDSEAREPSSLHCLKHSEPAVKNGKAE